ncbi:MAG: cache domain-containing protein, partial [Methanobacteriota archaeon]
MTKPEKNGSRYIFKSIRTKILISGGLALLLVAGIIIGYAAISINGIALEKAEKDLYAISQNEKATITSDLNNALDAARTMNEILTAVKTNNISLSREHLDSILKQVLEDNPRFVGTYAPYEPNAFDGNDAAYVNTNLSDATGRYLTYCNRNATTGEFAFEPLFDYEKPGIGNWYVTPKTTLKETLTEPIIYPVQGVDVQMTSLTVPIITDGKFQGITGVDYSLNSIDGRADAVDEYGGSARMFIISNGLKIIAMTGNNTHLGEELTKSGYPYHKDISDEETAIRTQKEQIVIKDGYLKILNPVTIGRTTTP